MEEVCFKKSAFGKCLLWSSEEFHEKIKLKALLTSFRFSVLEFLMVLDTL